MVRMFSAPISRMITSTQREACSGESASPPRGCPRAALLSCRITRSRISVAAALVKVMARMSPQPQRPPGKSTQAEEADALAGGPLCTSLCKKQCVNS